MNQKEMLDYVNHVRRVKDQGVHMFVHGDVSYHMEFNPYCLFGAYWEILLPDCIIHALDRELVIEEDRIIISGCGSIAIHFSDWELVE